MKLKPYPAQKDSGVARAIAGVPKAIRANIEVLKREADELLNEIIGARSL